MPIFVYGGAQIKQEITGSNLKSETVSVSVTDDSTIEITVSGLTLSKITAFYGRYTGSYPSSVGSLDLAVTSITRSGDGTVDLGYWISSGGASVFNENFTAGTYTYSNGILTISAAWHYIQGTYEFTVIGE